MTCWTSRPAYPTDMVQISRSQKMVLIAESSLLQQAREIMARHQHGSHAACGETCVMTPDQRMQHRAEVNAEIDAWIAKRETNPPTNPQEEVPF